MTTLTLIGEPFPDWEAEIQRAAIEDLTQALADCAPRACGTRLLYARGRDEPGFNSANIQVAQLPMSASMLPVVWQTSPTARPLDGEFVHSLTPMVPLRGRSSDDGSQSSVTVTHTLAWEAPQLLGNGPARLYRSFTRRAIKHADVVITPSYAVASVLQKRYGADLPIQVLPLATPSPLLEPGDAHDRRAHFSLPERYSVTTATPTEIGRLDWIFDAMERDTSIPVLVILEGVDPTSQNHASTKGRSAAHQGSGSPEPGTASSEREVSISADTTDEPNPVGPADEAPDIAPSGPRRVRRSKPLPGQADAPTDRAVGSEEAGNPRRPVRYAMPATPPPLSDAAVEAETATSKPATAPPAEPRPAAAPKPSAESAPPAAPKSAAESARSTTTHQPAAPKSAFAGPAPFTPPPFVEPEATAESLAGTIPAPSPAVGQATSAHPSAAPKSASTAAPETQPEPAEPTEQPEPTEQAEPTEAKAKKAAKPAKPAKQAKATKPAPPATQAKPASQAKPDKPPKPAKSAKPPKQSEAEDLSGVHALRERIPASLRDRVIVVKPRDLEDVGAAITGAEVMLQPQLLTGSGYLLHAALSAHVPIVHSECPTTHELVLDAGVSTENAEEFGDVVRRIAIDPEYRSALSVLASDRSRSFGWRATAWQLWELHANL